MRQMRKVTEITHDLILAELRKYGYEFIWLTGMLFFSNGKYEIDYAKKELLKKYHSGYEIFTNYNYLVEKRKWQKYIKRETQILLMAK